ncbi:hypothetical protein ACWT_2202 [Actinoplanes sp. SE50]|uniref:hypothetical protein n=1 Tax=unclassified Actinoplanes TaxID=2626549 RepID=UPI00023ECC78|nr:MULTISPECIES: hypothetical protein [unclassified Actinoplanes]AEV83222.1 hypothetical protein ACPL_2327 [Actinoplanes sp. SE50/110]ATO81617.1 hypothetical protein ACWT_2202 [Actinoplanes sp. SE50]SLL99025.1 hypothetical protein ACSP50_2253 [Actinoplanes sp. SE50/110]
MTTISSISNTAPYQILQAQAPYRPQPRPQDAADPGDGRQVAGLADPEKLTRVSDLLDMDTSDVTSAATSASSLVSLLQDRGVDFSQLRDVLNRTGDLLDVRA